jgi:hypothetical protein
MHATVPARGSRRRASSIACACAALASGAAVVLAGCGSQGPSSSASAPAVRAAPVVPGEHGPAAPGTPGASGAAAVRASGSQSASLTLATQDIVYTASLTVQARAGSVAAAVSRATAIVTAAGGYTAAEQEIIPPRRHALSYATLQLKIPVAAYQATLARLATDLGRQTSLTRQAQNVTQRVADVTSRVASAQAAIAQLRRLLTRAGSISALLSVQDQINAEESDLEALQAEQRSLAHETSYATVSLTLVAGPVAHVHKRKTRRQNGFLAGLASGWRAFRAVLTWLLTVLGAVLPFVAAVAAAGLLGWLGRRRLLRRRPTVSDPASPGPSP